MWSAAGVMGLREASPTWRKGDRDAVDGTAATVLGPWAKSFTKGAEPWTAGFGDAPPIGREDAYRRGSAAHRGKQTSRGPSGKHRAAQREGGACP